MTHKYIQPQKFRTETLKDSAIQLVENYINEHVDDYKNGEIVSIEYFTESGEKSSTNCVIEIINDSYKISALLTEKDTIKIIEKDGEEPPVDEKSLWLSDNWDSTVEGIYDASDLKSTVKRMAFEMQAMREELALCKEALTNTLGGGDILLNSTKYNLENAYDPEKPAGAPNPYTTGDTEIYSWDVYFGDSKLSEFSRGGLYKWQRYYPKVRAFNSAGEEIEITTAITVTMHCGGGTAEVSFTGKTLYALTSGDTTFYAEINDTIHSASDNKSYLLMFENNEEPSYEVYNVKHLLVKHAESFDYMVENSNYLLVGEFCWCIKEQALYLKEKAANGTIQLFKINGEGSVTPTGGTEVIKYVVTEDGVLSASSNDDSIRIDENGVLYLVGIVDENGVLILNDKQSGGGGGGGGDTGHTSGGTISLTARVDRDGTLIINGNGSENLVDRNGVLILAGEINRNGVLELDDQ